MEWTLAFNIYFGFFPISHGSSLKNFHLWVAFYCDPNRQKYQESGYIGLIIGIYLSDHCITLHQLKAEQETFNHLGFIN